MKKKTLLRIIFNRKEAFSLPVFLLSHFRFTYLQIQQKIQCQIEVQLMSDGRRSFEKFLFLKSGNFKIIQNLLFGNITKYFRKI